MSGYTFDSVIIDGYDDFVSVLCGLKLSGIEYKLSDSLEHDFISKRSPGKIIITKIGKELVKICSDKDVDFMKTNEINLENLILLIFEYRKLYHT